MTSVEPADVRAVLGVVRPEWDVQGCDTATGGGFAPVYRVEASAASGVRQVFVKFAPNRWGTGIPTEARVTALLAGRVEVPVPSVIGVVDHHSSVRAPAVVLGSLPGTEYAYERVGWVEDDFLRRTARDVGKALGQVHRLDILETFGHLGVPADPVLAGSRPETPGEGLTTQERYRSWHRFLRRWLDRRLEEASGSRFADLIPEIEAWCYDRLADLTDLGDPVLARNDHGYHNLLVDSDRGTVTAHLDWGYTVGMTPAFDLELAIYLYSGAFMAGHPAVPDRRELVRSAMLAGYRHADGDVPSTVRAPVPLYQMIARLRVMRDFEILADQLPEGAIEPVAQGLVEQTRAVLER